MNISDEAVEVAARALAVVAWGEWEYVPTELRGRMRRDARITLEAVAPFIAAQATALIADLLDPDPCSFDHNHSCQAHGYYYLKQDEACPQHDAKEWVKAYLRSGT